AADVFFADFFAAGFPAVLCAAPLLAAGFPYAVFFAVFTVFPGFAEDFFLGDKAFIKSSFFQSPLAAMPALFAIVFNSRTVFSLRYCFAICPPVRSAPCAKGHAGKF